MTIPSLARAFPGYEMHAARGAAVPPPAWGSERDWLTTDLPHRLLAEVMSRYGGGAGTRRKLQLAACAVVRRALPLVCDARVELACRVAESHAGGAASADDLRDAALLVAQAAGYAARGSVTEAAAMVGAFACHAEQIRFGAWPLVAWAEEAGTPPAALAGILRDVFGNPHRLGSSSLTAGWLSGAVWERCGGSWGGTAVLPHHVFAWSTGRGCRVVDVARTIYLGRRWRDLPAFADMLEEAGCESAEVLRACRGYARCPACLGEPGERDACAACGRTGWVRSNAPHVLGFWPLDLVLGY
jgi:hypothetical protein